MRHRIVLASQSAAWAVVEPMLAEVADLIPVHTVAQAFQVLERDAASIDLVICTVAFDESRMIEFLQAVKRRPAISSIPFLCSRILRSVLSESLISRVGTTCTDLGAVDFLDIGQLARDDAQLALRAAVVKYGTRRASN
jgi:hypothetical protein